ncbi:MAG: 3-isopropylmalate dehydratase small subunit [Phototrophicaceae bacterium]
MSEHRIWVYGDHINTDVIFAGKYTYSLKTPKEIASKALEDLDSQFVTQSREGDVIIAGRNWGCGSSREQAVTALKYNGVVAIIAESFNGLYFRNCINQGIHPIVCSGLRQSLKTGDTITIDREQHLIIAEGQHFTIPPLSATVRAIIDAGGLVPMLQQHYGEKAP